LKPILHGRFDGVDVLSQRMIAGDLDDSSTAARRRYAERVA